MNTEHSAIRINQEGYTDSLPVSAAVLTDQPILLKNAAGETLRVFAPDPPRTDLASGDPVTLLDLGFLDAGSYELGNDTLHQERIRAGRGDIRVSRTS